MRAAETHTNRQTFYHELRPDGIRRFLLCESRVCSGRVRDVYNRQRELYIVICKPVEFTSLI